MNSRRLQRFLICKKPRIFLLGTFERSVTVFNQQLRALNLAYELVEHQRDALRSVAVVGGGAAGMTVAAGLHKKGVSVTTLFERRSMLCPLQEGSDTRWIHPNIYDWPTSTSELPSAGLPILNWTAGRASDVAVQLSRGWDQVKRDVKRTCELLAANAKVPTPEICERLNTKYLKIREDGLIEWMCESRTGNSISGTSGPFSAIVLAVGFGDEISDRGGGSSYWRNETLSQPQLQLGTSTYLVSGYGDGAIVDLCRIRIEQFRQDRILAELVPRNSELRAALTVVRSQVLKKPSVTHEEFEKLRQRPDFAPLLERVRGRLRSDTFAVLRMGQDPATTVGTLFKYGSSFQNRFLLYLLFQAGAFVPSSMDEESISRQFQIDEAHTIRRHGTRRSDPIRDALTPALFDRVQRRLESMVDGDPQPDQICWKGGYWDDPSILTRSLSVADNVRRTWRLEYLPAPARSVASGVAAAIAGLLLPLHGKAEQYRVTIHRVGAVGGQAFLQQMCSYYGQMDTARKGEPGRAFPTNEGAIGLAFRAGQIVRSRLRTNTSRDLDGKDLSADMRTLALGATTMTMASEVRSILAVPATNNNGCFSVLFVDSYKMQLFEDDLVRQIAAMFSTALNAFKGDSDSRVHNFELSLPAAKPRRTPTLKLLQLLSPNSFKCPQMTSLQSINLEIDQSLAGN
jgi:hypothetical protein